MTATKQILLLEDTPERGVAIEKALKKAAKKQFQVSRFVGDKTDADRGAYEDRLHAEFASPKFKNLAMIVTDRDLSALPGYPGLSEAIVSRVATDLSVPVCVYAAGRNDSLIERHRSGGGGRILLDSADASSMAEKVCILADGFLKIRDVVLAVSKSKKMKADSRGPASVLARLLDAPEVTDQLALYTRGDQRMIAGLTPRAVSATQTPDEIRRVSLALGVWLYDSVLRFPGVVLGAVAAGSFLGVDPEQLGQPNVAKVFAKAAYGGPFADDTEPRWWRHRLAELLTTNGVSDGRELIKKRTKKAVKACVCSVDKKAPAGFICVMTEQPVCEEHSAGQIGWLPRGADLARVRRDLYEEIGPWVGMS
jgi:hypothetical protein